MSNAADSARMSAVLDAIERAIARGDLLAAHDRAMSAIDEGADAPRLRYYAVLSLARMGDAQRALGLYRKLGLDADSDVDAAALKGRLFKDIARTAPPDRRAALFAEARDAYLSVYREHGSYFPAINAASTALLAGDGEGARRLAGEVLAHPGIAADGDYYAAASALEASLLLADEAGARRWLERALGSPGADAGSRATTCRQIRLIGAALPEMHDAIAAICAALRPPPVVVYTGHMFREGGAGEAMLAARIAETLDRLGSTIAYGALACGADILIAEAILARGGELNVVLPFCEADFIEQSVLPGGVGWAARFSACIARATNVILATETGFVGDPAQFAYGSHIALGLGSIRARHILGDAVQLAILQGDAEKGAAGTALDVELWARLGHRTIVVDPGAIDRKLDRPPEVPPAARAQHSILFADFAGFSQLSEAQLPVFVDDVMGRIAAVLDAQSASVLSRNTWGDALYAVIDSPVAAAEIALAQQEALRELPASIPFSASPPITEPRSPAPPGSSR